MIFFSWPRKKVRGKLQKKGKRTFSLLYFWLEPKVAKVQGCKKMMENCACFTKGIELPRFIFLNKAGSNSNSLLTFRKLILLSSFF
jgi:hypothetical protein